MRDFLARFSFLAVILLVLSRVYVLRTIPFLSDTVLFHQMAMAAEWAGKVVYRDFFFAYPFLSWLFVKWPAAIGPNLNFEDYRAALRTAHMVLELAMVFFIYSRARKFRMDMSVVAGSLILYTVFSTFMIDLLYDRVDLLMTMCLFWIFAEWAAPKREWSLGAALATGFFVKLLPLGFWLLRFLELWRMDRKRAYRILWIPVSAIGILLATNFIYPGQLSALSQHGIRGIQVESTWAWPFLAARSFGFSDSVEIVTNIGAQEISQANIPFAYDLIARYSGFLLMLAVVSFFVWRRVTLDKLRLRCQFFLILLLAFLITQRVLSAQFLIWPIPFLAVYLASRWNWKIATLSFATFFLSFMCFRNYLEIMNINPPFVTLLGLRNLLLITLFGILCWQTWCETPAPSRLNN